jgi:Fe-Mn family superoxide dismutase
MKEFVEQKFDIPELVGMSKKSIEEHLKLYAGYVKNANLIGHKLGEMVQEDAEKFAYALTEVNRRFSFEYNGMRNHEVYFSSLSGGAAPLAEDSKLKKEIEDTWGSWDMWMKMFTMMAMTRGVGWAMLSWDRKDKRLLFHWVDEQHLGQLQDCALILALDMWEHSFVFDYQPSGKKNYVEDFFKNVNWAVIEDNFDKAVQ